MRAFRLAVATALLLGAAASVARAQTSPAPAPASGETSPPHVLQLTLDGVVDPFTANYVTSGISSANKTGEDAVLLVIDTPGGLSSSMREITQSILQSHVPVICFTYPEGARAASAGTFIMMACPVAAMAPGTNIGAAHPVGVSGAIESEKVTNDAVASIRALAERNGRNADWAEQAVRNSVSISAEEALKINVIDLISPTIPDLLNDVDGMQAKVADEQTVTLNTAGATIETESLGFFPSIAHALLTPDFAFLFFFLGIGLLILEFLHPGVSVPGILGFVFLAASIIAFFELPVQLVGIVLLIASAVCFFLELKHPGLGIPTVLGVIFLVAGGMLLFNPSVPNARVSPWLIAVVAGLIVLFLATAVQAVIKTRHLGPRPGLERYIGREATVVQPLDPVGVIHMGAENWTALVDHGHIPKGRTVRVTGVDGLRLTVEPAELATSSPPETDQKGTA